MDELLAQVYGVITYYLENQPAVDAYRARQARRFKETRGSVESLPEDLRERLNAAQEDLRADSA